VNASINFLSELARIGMKYDINAPTDLSENLDKYLWDEYEIWVKSRLSYFYSKDTNHEKATNLLQKATLLNAELIYPTTAITEIVTVLHRRFRLEKEAKAFAEFVALKGVNLETVTQKTLTSAIQDFYMKTKSKKNTLFDCIVASIAKRHKAAAIFSFDDFYRQAGFKLVEDL